MFGQDEAAKSAGEGGERSRERSWASEEEGRLGSDEGGQQVLQQVLEGL